MHSTPISTRPVTPNNILSTKTRMFLDSLFPKPFRSRDPPQDPARGLARSCPNSESMALHHISDNVWIGSLMATSSVQTFKNENITHVLSVLDLKAVGYKEETFSEMIRKKNLKHLYIDLQDTEEEPILRVFEQTNAFIDEAVSNNGGILIHCIAGISRSVTVACAYLMWKNKWTDEQTIDFVQTKRRIANPNDSFRQQLHVYYLCGYEISKDKKPYREWLLKSQASDFHQGICPDVQYTDTDVAAFKLTWRHVVPRLTAAKVTQLLVDGKPVAITERVESAVLEKTVELVTEEGPIIVSPLDLRQTIDKLAVKSTVLRCKNCSTPVATSGSFVAHEAGKQGPCQHHHMEPVEWMRPELEKSEIEGKLACPKCAHKLGAYAWQGAKCSCGTWVTPSIRLQKGRVDCMVSQQKPLL